MASCVAAARSLTVPLTAEGAGFVTTAVLRDALPELQATSHGVLHLSAAAGARGRAALTLLPRADDARGVLAALRRLSSEQAGCSGDDDAADFLQALVGVSLALPVAGGALALGTGREQQEVVALSFAAEGDRGSELEVVCTLFEGGRGGTAGQTTLRTQRRGCTLSHDQAISAVPAAAMRALQGPATLSLWMQDTGASLTLNENCDPDVRHDMAACFRRIVPEDKLQRALFARADEGADACAAIVLRVLVGSGLCLPVGQQGGRVCTGTWQGVWLNEHRNGPAERAVTAELLPARAQATLSVNAGGRGTMDITSSVDAIVAEAGVDDGVAHVFVRHTSASCCIAAARFSPRLEDAFSNVVPRAWHYDFFRHTAEGEDDMVGHVKSTLIGATCSVPVRSGQLRLPDGAAVLLVEHRDGGGFGSSSRQIIVTVQ